MIHSNTIIFHNRSDFHKTAQHLRNIISEPIKDIEQKVIEYKMIHKYMKKTFNNDSSSNCQLEEQPQNEITDEKILQS
jgi:hypothetical protein